MTTYYVSNTAVNGTYVVGNDGNAGTTPATAKLTVDGAITAASASDTIYINPSGVSYSENSSGLNYLQINKATLTIETDPTYVLTVGKATITSPAAGTRTVNMNQTGIILRNLKIDNASQTRNCCFCQSFASQTYVGLVFLNLGANAIAITAQNNNAYNVTADKCTLLTADGNAAGTKLLQCTGTLGGMVFSITGCKTDTTGGLATLGAGVGGSLTINQSTDGTRTSVSNATLGIQNLSADVTTTFSINNTDFNACATSIGDGGTTTATLANLVVKNCLFSGLTGSLTAKDMLFVSTISAGEIAYCSFMGSHQNISFSSGAIAGIKFHDNLINTPAMGTAISNVLMTRGGAGIECYNNIITTNTESRVIGLGGDGYASAITNSGGALSGDQDLGAAAGNTYVAQTFTYPAAGTALFARYLGSFDVYLKKVGSPTGTVNAYLYTNSAGAPGTLVATSAYTLTSSLLTTSYQQVRFWFTSRTQLSYSTQYWIVIKYTGTVDGANYVRVEKYTAGTVGQTSTNGTVWSAGAAALGYDVRQINLEMTQPKIYNNYINATNATNIVHCIIINATDGALAYQNQIYGGAIGVLFKLVDGVTQTAIAYNNIINFSNTGDGAVLHDKGSTGAQWYNNTATVSSGNNKALFLEGDWLTGYLNGVPTTNPIAKNNIIDSNSNLGGSIIQFGNANAFDFTCINPNTDYNVYFDITAKTFAKVNLGQAATLTTYTTLGALQAGIGTDANSIQNDPYLYSSNPTQPKEFQLLAISPIIGRGVTLAIPTTDYFEYTRIVPNTAGAIQFVRRTNTGTRVDTTTRNLV